MSWYNRELHEHQAPAEIVGRLRYFGIITGFDQGFAPVHVDLTRHVLLIVQNAFQAEKEHWNAAV